ncbi:Hsp70 family protein [Paenibacillus sacheonensis]|uniref:Chaperone protein DnaK n=1 Tax=Paenibacillus sacheonensis TaxID=742054 RepID=A0A7X4YWU4_9BACL|nr:Hsp70 family protein [Paenibacillus sacheonensis]MBM7568088.1 molecular chaperone DnaK (HSP70) [Paenibacillus sacheonensis]NBC72884.1 Hsp70 family protein [Paenibacillus sacheonensis]
MPRTSYGIDFGTTNSSIALMRTDVFSAGRYTPQCFILSPNGTPREVIPSEISFDGNGNIVSVGRRARMDVASMAADKLVDNVKWLLDRDDYSIRFGKGAEYNPVQLASILFSRMKESINSVPHNKPDGIVIGVPVGFGDVEKERLLQALIESGLAEGINKRNIRFLSEPIAVALDYGLQLENPQKVLVFDFGGGTLDITVVSLATLEGEVLSKHGAHIGGRKLTTCLLTHVFIPKYGYDKLSKALNLPKTQPDNETLLQYLFDTSEGVDLFENLDRCKIELSSELTSSLFISRDNLKVNLTITRVEFEEAISKELQESHDLVLQSLKEAGVKSPDMVVMAGGSSYIPAFKVMLQTIFGIDKVKLSSDALTSVARGLSIAGFSTDDGITAEIEDIVDISYGIWDGSVNQVAPVIEKGIKVSDTEIDDVTIEGIYETFQLMDQSSTFMKLRIYQGDNQIGIVEVPIKPNGSNNHFKVFFQVDKDKGWLKIRVYDISNRKWLTIPFGKDKIRIRENWEE